jgi:hypothetical protein
MNGIAITKVLIAFDTALDISRSRLRQLSTTHPSLDEQIAALRPMLGL